MTADPPHSDLASRCDGLSDQTGYPAGNVLFRMDCILREFIEMQSIHFREFGSHKDLTP